VDLPIEQFSKMKASRDGYQYVCKGCQKQRWDFLPEETRKSYYATYDKRNAAKRADNARKRDPKAKNSARLLYLYGITQEEYDQLLVSQDGKCAICHRVQPEGARRMHVDHDNTLGGDRNGVRGILCPRCNHLIGNAQDRVDILVTAAQYLQRYVDDGSPLNEVRKV
jgi:hypothetical protein